MTTTRHKSISVAAGLVLLCSAASPFADQTETELISPNVQDNGAFGSGCGGLPDQNGDGVGEFFVQADAEKRIYVYDGANLKLLFQIELSGGCAMGLELVPAGDLNADGISEFMVKSTCSNSVQFLDGATRAELFKLTAPISGRAFGNLLRLLPDMTGDGKEDWLIHQLDWETQTGRVYIFDSQTRKNIRTIQNSEAAYRFYLQNVEVFPDVDGDAKPDLLIGGHSARVVLDGTGLNAGRVLVRSSATGKVLYELKDPEPQKDGGFGLELKGTGDINADGIGDIAVGTHFKDFQTGAIYLFSGKDGQWLRTLRSPELGTRQRFGRNIELLPDLNADGVPELWTQEDALSSSYIFDGLTSTLLRTTQHPRPVGGFIFSAIVRQQSAPGVHAFLFGDPFAYGSGRVYYVPFTALPKAARLHALAKTSSNFRLQISAEPGTRFEIQATSDFLTWEPANTVDVINTEPVPLDAPAALNQPRRFYRAIQLP